jgi:hypothetical protein
VERNPRCIIVSNLARRYNRRVHRLVGRNYDVSGRQGIGADPNEGSTNRLGGVVARRDGANRDGAGRRCRLGGRRWVGNHVAVGAAIWAVEGVVADADLEVIVCRTCGELVEERARVVRGAVGEVGEDDLAEGDQLAKAGADT